MALRIILADDHAIFRQGLVALLQAEPDIALLAEAANGDDAWRLIQTLNPDIAILDLAMPGASGIEVTRRIEDAALDTRAVLLTMHNDPLTAIEAQRAGVAGYVLKDNSFEELLLAARTVAAGGTFVSPVVGAKLRALQREGRAPVPLSPRERDVIRLIAQGKTNKEIAKVLSISPRTVETFRERLMTKLDLRTRADIVRYAVQAGLVP